MEPAKLIKFKDYKEQRVKYIQPKFDGHFTNVIVSGSGCNSLRGYKVLTKNDKDITDKLLKIKHIRHELAGLPPNSQVWGELHCPDVLATSIPTMLIAADEKLQFTAFAAPWLANEDMSETGLPGVMMLLQDYGIAIPHTRHLNDTHLTEKEKQQYLELAIEKKLEGYVLKVGHMGGWFKLKPVRTIDAFVIDVKMSTSASFYGCLQSICLGLKTRAGTVHDLGQAGSGFTSEYRLTLDTQEKRAALIGKVCELSYDSVTAGHKLRFPRFVRWRDDKNADQCTTEQLGD